MAADRLAAAGRTLERGTGLRILGGVALAYGVGSATSPGLHGEHLAALVLTVATGLAWLGWLIARHRKNQTASVASLVALAVCGGALVGISPVGVPVIGFAALGAASLLDLLPAVGIAAAGVAAAAIAIGVTGDDAALIGGAAIGALVGAVFGLARRQQQARIEQTAQLASAQERSELEHARAEVLDERNRIAREVHDVLAHTLSALSVQMEALASLVDDDPGQPAVRDAVARSRRLVVDGLEETRRAVRVLRDEPVALVEQIAALAHDDNATFSVQGTPRTLPPAEGLALLRVAQESLTNARKHAPGTTVTIVLTFNGTNTLLAVGNTEPVEMPATKSVGGGYGLRGMRERVELLGGSLTAGPSANGWQVQADVPT